MPAAEPMTGGRRAGARIWLAAAAAAALAGALLVAALPADPYANPDSRAFVALGQSVARGEGLAYEDQGTPGFALRAFRPPLYPILLGGLLALGFPLHAALPLQGACYGACVAFAAWSAGRAAGRRAALIAGAAALLWWPAWLAAGQYLTETLYTLLLACALGAATLALTRDSVAAALIAGVLTGAGLLARATGAATGAACGAALAARAPRLALPFLLGVLLVWAPWAVRNRAVLGEWVWLQTSGGMNVWAGNTGGAIRDGWRMMAEDLPRAGEVGAERAFYRRTAAWAREHPGALLRRVAERALSYLAPLDRAPEYLAYRLALPFVLLGAWVALRDARWTLALLAWSFHALLGALTVTSLRYRLPAELPALLLGVAGVEWLIGRLGARRGALACGLTLVLGAAAAGVQGLIKGGS